MSHAARANPPAASPARRPSSTSLHHPPATPSTMQDIRLQLTLDDLNLILEAVGQLPFARVYALVGKIQSQAAGQLQAAAPAEGAVPAALAAAGPGSGAGA